MEREHPVSTEQKSEFDSDLATAQARVAQLQELIRRRHNRPNLLRTAIDTYVRTAQQRDQAQENKE